MRTRTCSHCSGRACDPGRCSFAALPSEEAHRASAARWAVAANLRRRMAQIEMSLARNPDAERRARLYADLRRQTIAAFAELETITFERRAFATTELRSAA